MNSDNRLGSVARSTLIIMIGWGISTVISIFRQRVIAVQFGTTLQTDAFTAANTVPELLFTALSGGALAFAFIPIYTEFLTDDDKGDPNKLFSNVINVIFFAFAAGALLAALGAPFLVTNDIIGVGVGFSPEGQQLTIDMLRILLLANAIFAVSSVLTATLYAHQHFIIPAIIPGMYSVGIIIGTLLLGPQIGIYGVAWGAVIGAGMHFLIQLPVVISKGITWKPTFSLTDAALRTVIILMAPRVIDLFLARASINWVSANLVSRLDDPGQLAALEIARSLSNMPWTIIGTSIGVVIFPTLAEMAARNDLKAQRDALSGALRAVLTLTIPAAVGLVVLGQPIIRILFEGGEFDARSTQLVYYALQFFTVAIISQSMLDVVVRAFAAQKDTYTPLYVSFFTTALNIGLAIWLTNPQRIAHAGPALANGVAVLIESLIGLTILHIRWKGIHAGRTLLDTGKALIAAGVMAAAIVLFNQMLQPSDLILIAGGGLIGITVYFGVAMLLGLREIRDVPMALLKRATPAEITP